jgi:hypothetical protein
VGAVLVLAVVAVADALRPGRAADRFSSPRETVAVPEIQQPGGKPAIERIGAAWARHFASNGLDDCFHTGQELCDRLHCIRVGGHRIATCKLPTPAYRRSFRTAAVDVLVVEQYEALARLSNGELIRLHADGGTWWVLALGPDTGRGFFEKAG